MRLPLFLGIDIGTQGARVVLINSLGDVVSNAEENFPLNEASRTEQSPVVWWEVCSSLLKRMMAGSASAIDPESIKGMAVTSTSGTVIPLDKDSNPLHPAIMYSDKRAVKEAKLCRETAESFYPEGYTGFNTSSGLSKMIWFAENYPEKTKLIHKWVHAADYITGKLTGIWGVTDYTNALKSGYDVDKECWPDYLFDRLGLQKEWMPEVFASGKVIGKIDKNIAEVLGLSALTNVVVGITDGCASQIASGAINPGDWNTTIGTTLVIKGVTSNPVIDPKDRFYSHRHPQGYWMPGGASNTGADWVSEEFGDHLARLDQKAMKMIPSGFLSYPLRQKGERFPFIAEEARGFEPDGLSREERFVSNMEGVAYLERYAYELVSRLSGEKVKAVYSAGGGSLSKSWLKIRSNVLNLPVFRMKTVSGAFGAAVLAASQTHFHNLTEAGAALIQIEKEVYPEEKLSRRYASGYYNFIALLKEKGYIDDDDYA